MEKEEEEEKEEKKKWNERMRGRWLKEEKVKSWRVFSLVLVSELKRRTG